MQERHNTGAIKFGEDWPGIFIRGDDALAFSNALKDLDGDMSAMKIAELIKLLDSAKLEKNDRRI